MSEKKDDASQSVHSDAEKGQAPELKRNLKARHLQMIAIGKIKLASIN